MRMTSTPGQPGETGPAGRRRSRRPPVAASAWQLDFEGERERRWRIVGLVPVLPGWRVVEASEDPAVREQGRPERLEIDVSPLIAWALLESADGEQQIRGVTVERNVPQAVVVGLDETYRETVGVPDDLFLAYLAPGEELTDKLRDRARKLVRAVRARTAARLRRRRDRGELGASAP
jgi:hypothetical protein